MTTQIIDKIDMLDFKDLSTIVGGALKGIGYGIKDGITYGLICRYQAITESIFWPNSTCSPNLWAYILCLATLQRRNFLNCVHLCQYIPGR